MPLKRKLYIVVILGTIASATPYLLYKFSSSTSKNAEFTRNYATNKVTPIASLPRSPEVYNISGIRDGVLYFSSIYPGEYFTTDSTFALLYKNTIKNTHFQHSHVPYQMFINEGQLYICIGNYKIIYIADIKSNLLIDSVHTGYVFTRSQFIPPNSFAIRCFDTIAPLDQIFAKIDVNSRSIMREHNISNKHGDAGISSDGQVLYDPLSYTILYSQFHDSHIIKIDTNLNKLSIFQTVNKTDSSTTTGGKEYLKSIEIVKYTNTSPRYNLNLYNWIDGNNLFILSGAKSSNESLDKFNSQTNIDIYNLKENRYISTISLPNKNNEKAKQFALFDRILVVLYKSNIVIYKLSGEI